MSTYPFLRDGSLASAGWVPTMCCAVWGLSHMTWSFPHPLLSILSSMCHSFILMMLQVMAVGSCPLILSLLRASQSLR